MLQGGIPTLQYEPARLRDPLQQRLHVPLDMALADRTCSPDGNDIAGLDIAHLGAHVAGREMVCTGAASAPGGRLARRCRELGDALRRLRGTLLGEMRGLEAGI
jgi:hypothetical protein